MPSWHTLKWGRSCELLLDDEVGDIPTDAPAPELQGTNIQQRSSLLVHRAHFFFFFFLFCWRGGGDGGDGGDGVATEGGCLQCGYSIGSEFFVSCVRCKRPHHKHCIEPAPLPHELDKWVCSRCVMCDECHATSEQSR